MTDMRGSLGIRWKAEHRDHRMPCGGESKLGQIECCRLFQIGNRFLDTFPLSGGARLGVQRDITAFLGGRKNGSKFHGDASQLKQLDCHALWAFTGSTKNAPSRARPRAAKPSSSGHILSRHREAAGRCDPCRQTNDMDCFTAFAMTAVDCRATLVIAPHLPSSSRGRRPLRSMPADQRHGLLHCVRNDRHGLLHCVRNDGCGLPRSARHRATFTLVIARPQAAAIHAGRPTTWIAALRSQ